MSLKYVKDGSESKKMKRLHFTLWFKDFSRIQMRTLSFPRDMNMNGDLKRFCSCDVALQGRGNGFVMGKVGRMTSSPTVVYQQ